MLKGRKCSENDHPLGSFWHFTQIPVFKTTVNIFILFCIRQIHILKTPLSNEYLALNITHLLNAHCFRHFISWNLHKTASSAPMAQIYSRIVTSNPVPFNCKFTSHLTCLSQIRYWCSMSRFTSNHAVNKIELPGVLTLLKDCGVRSITV